MVGERAYARARALLLLHSALSARVLAHARHLRFYVSSAPLARLSSSTFCWKKGGGGELESRWLRYVLGLESESTRFTRYIFSWV